MKDATCYYVLTDGTILNQNFTRIVKLKGFKESCAYVRQYITGVRSTTFTEDAYELGESQIFVPAA